MKFGCNLRSLDKVSLFSWSFGLLVIYVANESFVLAVYRFVMSMRDKTETRMSLNREKISEHCYEREGRNEKKNKNRTKK